MSIRPLSLLALLLLTLCAPASAATWPRGEVIIPTRLFQSRNKLDRVVLESNPRLYLPREHDPRADLVMVIGMPGWGGRSENFIGTLYNGLSDPKLRRRLVLAAIQDPRTRGPRFQGQGEAIHANVWSLDDESIPALRHFISRVAEDLAPTRAVTSGALRSARERAGDRPAPRPMEVYLFGFSSGSPAAPPAALRIALFGPSTGFVMKGAISVGTGSPVSAKKLKQTGQRVLILVVPKIGKHEPKAHRYDQGKRAMAELTQIRLADNGATSYLRHIHTARRHFDWHWGLVSQCRYYKPGKYDEGRGYWPNYWMPNPETFGHMAAFIQGQAPPETLSPPLTRCPRPPNPNNAADPDAKVNDPSRQTPWAPGTETLETIKLRPATP